MVPRLSVGRRPAVAVAGHVDEDVKKSSSKWIKTQGPEFTAFAWQSGYGAFAVSESNVETVRQYIANQRERHRTNGRAVGPGLQPSNIIGWLDPGRCPVQSAALRYLGAGALPLWNANGAVPRQPILSPNGAVPRQPGATPQEPNPPTDRGPKARSFRRAAHAASRATRRGKSG